MRHIFFADDLERQIAYLLESMDVEFLYETESGNESGLDFYLPSFDVYIEVKQFDCERSGRQLAKKDNVILIQGRKSIKLLQALIK